MASRIVSAKVAHKIETAVVHVDQGQERRGRALAVAMLRALRTDWETHKLPEDLPDEWIGEAMIAREPSVLREYFAKVQDAGSADLELGFLRVLTDLIGGSAAGPIDVEVCLRSYEGRRHE